MLQEKEIWELVDLPDGTIPLKNKWVFVLKRDREGTIIRYKAQLVVKGCGQRLGFNYLETHSPVICMESIHAVLAIATQKHFPIQQMDVKGAYLNATLKETIYMHQPEGLRMALVRSVTWRKPWMGWSNQDANGMRNSTPRYARMGTHAHALIHVHIYAPRVRGLPSLPYGLTICFCLQTQNRQCIRRRGTYAPSGTQVTWALHAK